MIRVNLSKSLRSGGSEAKLKMEEAMVLMNLLNPQEPMTGVAPGPTSMQQPIPMVEPSPEDFMMEALNEQGQ